MTDVHSKEIRSYNMSRIRGKNTKPELLVRKLLHFKGFRFRIHVKDLPGNPDIVLPKYKTIIFVHGCFWHRHNGCNYSKIPSSNLEYWRPKLQKNVDRDFKAEEDLRLAGWKVIIVWECELKNKSVENTLTSLLAGITS